MNWILHVPNDTHYAIVALMVGCVLPLVFAFLAKMVGGLDFKTPYLWRGVCHESVALSLGGVWLVAGLLFAVILFCHKDDLVKACPVDGFLLLGQVLVI